MTSTSIRLGFEDEDRISTIVDYFDKMEPLSFTMTKSDAIRAALMFMYMELETRGMFGSHPDSEEWPGIKLALKVHEENK